jgi:hypothetical protein
MPNPMPLGTALLADAALSLLLWNCAIRLAIAAGRWWPGVMRALV